MKIAKPTKTRNSSVVLQPDDHEILRLLAEDFLLLTPEHLKQFFPGRSLKAIKKRLEKLARAGHLSRRHPGFTLLDASRVHYYLGTKSVDVLSPAAPDLKLLRRLKRARNFSDAALPHLNFINLIHIKFCTASIDYSDYQLTSWTGHDDPVWTQIDRSSIAFRPDGFVQFSKAGISYLYFLEADRGTYRGKHLVQRLEAYKTYANASRYPNSFRFSHPRFRVLFITATRHRAKHLLKPTAAFHPDLFWIASLDNFQTKLLFHAHWRSHDTKELHSLDEPYEVPHDPPEPPPPPDQLAN